MLETKVKTSTKVSVLLASDNSLLQAGIRSIVNSEENLILASGMINKDFFQEFSEDNKPQIILLDTDISSSVAQETVSYIQKHFPSSKIILLVTDKNTINQDFFTKAIRGCLLKNEPLENFVKAIFRVAKGRTWYSQGIMERLMQLRTVHISATQKFALSDREKEMLRVVGKGWNNARIAAEFNLARQTVNNYLSRIYSKISVNSRAEAIVWARERQI
jgi:two-component system nitrate/nitrite response regulator NarL/two-component system response regulator NreC